MKAIIAPIDIILRWFLIVLAVLMVLTVSWQVFSRYADWYSLPMNSTKRPELWGFGCHISILLFRSVEF